MWDETVALEGRVGYDERVGAPEDMVQNHLLQLPCLMATEPLNARLDPPALPADGGVLLDFLDGDSTLSIRGDEDEESWRITEPVTAARSRDLIPLDLYPAASDGPVR